MWQLSSCFPHFKYINTQRLISVAELKPSVKSGFSIFKAWAQSFGGSVETKLTGGLSRPAAYCHHDGKQEGSPHQAAVAAKRLGSALLPAVHIKAPHKLFFASLENFHDHTNRPHKLFSICFLYCLTSSFNYCFFFFCTHISAQHFTVLYLFCKFTFTHISQTHSETQWLLAEISIIDWRSCWGWDGGSDRQSHLSPLPCGPAALQQNDQCPPSTSTALLFLISC